MMDEPEDNQGDDIQEFRGFRMDEIKRSETDEVEDEVNHENEAEKEEDDEEEEEEDDDDDDDDEEEEEDDNDNELLPNGTDEVKEGDDKLKDDSSSKDEDEEEEEQVEGENGGGEGGEDGVDGGEEGGGGANSDTTAENDLSAEETSNKEDEEETKEKPSRKRQRSTSNETNQQEKMLKEGIDDPEPEETGGYRSSDEEDFLGFDLPDNSKEEFIRALINEPESLDSDAGTPLAMKTQTRVSRSPWKKTVSVDLSNPEYKKPFKYGWVRELVYRSTSDTALRRNADIYYFTPKGKKVRSFREVAEHLSGDLSVDNFTFFKGPIGIGDPEKEIIREAKAKPISKSVEDGLSTPVNRKILPKLKSTSTSGKSAPKGMSSDLSSPKTSLTPRVMFKANSVVKNKTTVSIKSKLGIKDKKRKSAGPDDMNCDDWSPEQKANPGRDVCSIECRLAMGLIPTLQCHLCLCLYHPECVGALEAKHRVIHSYVCKNCQLVKSGLNVKSVGSSLPLPPPLTPISNIAPRTPLKPVSPPKRDIKLVTVPRSQSIVGAVTTWLPPSSSIQVSQPAGVAKSTAVATSTSPSAASEGAPQSLVSLNGKQYVVVPKHNVVNIINQPNCTPAPQPPPPPLIEPTQQHVASLVPTAPGSGAIVVANQPLQNITSPPGVLLVPYTVQQASSHVDPAPAATHYVIMNHSAVQPPNFIIGNLNQTSTNNPSTQAQSTTTSAPAQTNGIKRSSTSPITAVSPPPEKKQKTKDNLPTTGAVSQCTHPVMKNFMMNLNAGFFALLHAFQYLKVHELLRASCVSHMWNHITSHSSLWETVRMKNSRVRDWGGFGRALATSGTRNLDLKKMLLPDKQEAIVEMWNQLSKAISNVKSLRRIDMGRCIPEAVESIASSCPQLESLTSLTIRGSELDVTAISKCTNLVELRLKSIGGMDVTHLSSLVSLKGLKHLSLTTVKSLTGIEEILSENLETLELGECSTLSEEMASTALPKLVNLRKLRLERGQMPSCPVTQLLNTVATLPKLTQLELINFDVKPGFDKALAKCTNLRTLLIIPTYVTQSATTNHVVMGGVSKLSSTLTYFVWGLTLELLRVTDLFVDQVEGQKVGSGGGGGGGGKGGSQGSGSKKGCGDSIPILKPIVEDGSEAKEGHTTSQVDILALPKLQKVLSTLLPTTKIKILKVPFSATWRQTVSDVPQ